MPHNDLHNEYDRNVCKQERTAMAQLMPNQRNTHQQVMTASLDEHQKESFAHC